MFSPPYFPAAFFPMSFFPSTSAPGPGPTAVAGRDREAFAAIAGALAATREFAAVAIGTLADRPALGAESLPAALLTPLEWVELEDSAPGAHIRRVTFALTLIVRAPDGAERCFELDRLGVVAQAAIEGLDLGVRYSSAPARLRRGRGDPSARPPEGRAVLTGEITYPIPPTGA